MSSTQPHHRTAASSPLGARPGGNLPKALFDDERACFSHAKGAPRALPRRVVLASALTWVAAVLWGVGVVEWARRGARRTAESSAAAAAAVRAPASSCAAEVAAHVAAHKASAVKWRRAVGAARCGAGARVSVTGSWCLTAAREAWPAGLGRAARSHVVADGAVGRALQARLGGRGMSLVDIGAGVGQYGHWLRKNNASLEWHGFDGAENVEEFTAGFVRWTDATDETLDTVPFRADWVMSLEVAEHIPPEATDRFVQTLDRHNRKGIIISWAIATPWQGGLQHINNKDNGEVAAIMKRYGYVQDKWCKDFQAEVRRGATYRWLKNTFMVFVREVPFAEQ